MANLQIKGIDEDFYQDLKRMAAAGHRSVSGMVLASLKEYLAKQGDLDRVKTPGQVLLSLSGAWQDDRSAAKVAAEIRAARRSSRAIPGF
jgi:plasmid stability protein